MTTVTPADSSTSLETHLIPDSRTDMTRLENRSLDGQEVATILAALRHYKRTGQGDPANRTDEIHEIATKTRKRIGKQTAASLEARGIKPGFMKGK